MSDGSNPKLVTDRTRPELPARAVVTAGMPYGNKDLHFGHVGGVFVHADAFARFLRDRIGADNVLFVSGTDCYGSPIAADHRAKVETGEFKGDLNDFVTRNHQSQKATLDAYHVQPDAFAASSLPPWQPVHQQLGAEILRTLHENGHLRKLTTPQFYDRQAETFLNGRQVIGRCPIAGCKSEKAYADECSLGHQYEPRELIAPKSTLSDEPPVMVDVTNWYIPLQEFRDLLKPWLDELLENGQMREFAVRSLLEYFQPPTIHVQKAQLDELGSVLDDLPPHTQEQGRGKSIKLVFQTLEDMEAAKEKLSAAGGRYRSGKTLVPFRLTGNLDWSLPAPDVDGLDGLTFWVWPESLWAPISFVRALLQQRSAANDEWQRWWCSPDAKAFQFIGEDNTYFYGLAQGAIWLGMQGTSPEFPPPAGDLSMSHLVVNKHLLFLDKKASSSGKVKPPMAMDLLEFYTADQLRAHWLSLGLGQRSVSFRPKPLDPKADERAGDPVLKEGNLLSNTMNHLVRSCFYTVQKFYESVIPSGAPREEVVAECETAILEFEQAFAGQEFHAGIDAVAALLRQANSRWNRNNPFYDDCDEDLRRQGLIDAFHVVRTATVLLHPIAPAGTEKVRDYLNLDASFWDWSKIFLPLSELMDDPASHRLKELPPRSDFFDKHPSQIK